LFRRSESRGRSVGSKRSGRGTIRARLCCVFSLIGVDDSPIRVHRHKLPGRRHRFGRIRRPQSETLLAAHENHEVIVEIVVQAARRADVMVAGAA